MADEETTGEWVAIPGFEGAYEINAQGAVRSWKPWRNLPLPRDMTVQRSATGQRTLQLGLYGGTHDVDQLVTELFGTREALKELSDG